jgi:hypothetical protein
MTTASALASRCDTRFKGSSNSVVSAASWLAYLNEAYNRVNVFTPLWPWLETSEQSLTVPDSGTVGAVNNRSAALPTDVLGVNWVYDVTDDYRLIDQMGRGDFFHQDHLRSEVGQPVTYRVRGSSIELNPTPNVATSIVLEAILCPTALAADTVSVTSHTGAVAGNVTATGVHVGDTLLSVVGVKTSDQSVHDFTSEFTITATNTINNSGGTTTAGYVLTVTWRTLSSSASPVFPSAYHDILIDGALAAAYLDDGNAAQGKEYEDRFTNRLTHMMQSVLMNRTETNQPVRDTFWS